MNPKMHSHVPQPNFLNLSLELREMIYKEYFKTTDHTRQPYHDIYNSSDFMILPCTKLSKPLSPKSPIRGSLALLLTNPSIYSEATRVLYSQATFVFSDKSLDVADWGAITLDKSGYCACCRDTREQIYTGAIMPTLHGVRPCLRQAPNSHRFVLISHIIYATTWLQRIGPRNRALLTRIDLFLATEDYIFLESQRHDYPQITCMGSFLLHLLKYMNQNLQLRHLKLHLWQTRYTVHADEMHGQNVPMLGLWNLVNPDVVFAGALKGFGGLQGFEVTLSPYVTEEVWPQEGKVLRTLRRKALEARDNIEKELCKR